MSPTRLCLIGNSHLAAMKLGWDKLVRMGDPLVDGVEVTYFGAPRDMLRNVEVQAGHLVPTNDATRSQFVTLSGRDHVDPMDHDAFLLVGVGASIKRVLRLYRGYRWSGVSATPSNALISRAFARSFLVEGYSGGRLVDLGVKLASITDKPIFAVPEPYWSPQVSPVPGNRDFGWMDAAASGDGPALSDLFQDALTTAVGPRMQLLFQPPSTIEDGIVTRAEFNKGADKDISGVGGGADAAHMNLDFGVELWRHHLATMRQSRRVDPTHAK
jgi:hypothetical protein